MYSAVYHSQRTLTVKYCRSLYRSVFILCCCFLSPHQCHKEKLVFFNRPRQKTAVWFQPWCQVSYKWCIMGCTYAMKCLHMYSYAEAEQPCMELNLSSLNSRAVWEEWQRYVYMTSQLLFMCGLNILSWTTSEYSFIH